MDVHFHDRSTTKKPYFIGELWHVHAIQHTAVCVHITPLTYYCNYYSSCSYMVVILMVPVLYYTSASYSLRQKSFSSVLLETFNSHEWSRQNFSLQYQYNIKHRRDENKVKYQLGDYSLIQYQFLQIDVKIIAWRTVRRITKEILGGKGLIKNTL